ncbi:TPA: amidase [Clostridium botulinum]|nr:amidase [Clostridium botulinum]HDK7206548.1 amidase [Clostridium botulinum]HDK7210283.1 amidase [Clostridium botulinum]HDK7265733.1 amidase [Clostridium botulinum]HDK7269580.1 amidase [Clostridium botulinum]
MLPIQKKLVRYNYSSSNNIQYIVVHDTGNTGRGANANAHYNYFNGGDRQSSAHYFVDDNNIIQIIEDWNASWHCGDGGGRYEIGNHNSIGIEICINSDGNYNKAVSNAIELVKYKMKQYGIPVSRVVRHYDASRKNCPASMSSNGWAKWNWFKSQLGGNVSSPSPSPSKPTAVVTASALNVREKKSTSSKILGTLANGKSVEVYKVEGDWVHIYYPPNGGFIAKQYVKLYNIPNTKKSENKPEEKKEEIKVKNIICYQYGLDENAAEYLGDFLNCSTIETHRPYDYKNVENIFAVGGDKKVYTSYLNTLISGSDANNTFERTIGYILTKKNIKWNVTKHDITSQEKNAKNKIVIYNNYVDKRAAEYLATTLNCPLKENKNINAANYDFIYLVGDDKDAPQSNNIRNIKGQDRYLTAKEVIDFMKFV